MGRRKLHKTSPVLGREKEIKIGLRRVLLDSEREIKTSPVPGGEKEIKTSSLDGKREIKTSPLNGKREIKTSLS